MTISRRTFLTASILGSAATYLAIRPFATDAAQAKAFPYSLSDAAWRKKLTAGQYAVLRQKATERPFSSPLNDEHRKGTFLCAGCDLALYSSATKFDSGTGWPSFWQPLPRAVETSTDYAIGYPRTEVHCARCGGHLGHVFDDGPKPTGKRYCMNGVAMRFVAS